MFSGFANSTPADPIGPAIPCTVPTLAVSTSPNFVVV